VVLVGPPLSDRLKVKYQIKRSILILQVGGLAFRGISTLSLVKQLLAENPNEEPWTVSSAMDKAKKRTMIFGTWNVQSLCKLQKVIEEVKNNGRI